MFDSSMPLMTFDFPIDHRVLTDSTFGRKSAGRILRRWINEGKAENPERIEVSLELQRIANGEIEVSENRAANLIAYGEFSIYMQTLWHFADPDRYDLP
jgi:hypothetical protein